MIHHSTVPHGMRRPAGPSPARLAFFLCTCIALAAAVAPPAGGSAPSRRAHGFRADGSAWTAAGAGYTVRAAADAFDFAPVGPRARTGAAPAAPLRFEAADIARGDHPIGGAAPSARPAVDARGELVLDRGDVAQRLRAAPEGVELSYDFPRRPDGAGDVTVRVRVSGQAYAGEGAAGHRFADAVAGIGARVGRATWIDARGARADVPVRAVPGGLEMRVAAHVVDASAYPAVLDPLISPEMGTDAPVFGAAGSAQTRTAAAFDGAQHLVVWEDARGPAPAIYGARVAADGTVLDPYGLYLADGQDPKVAAGGGVFLVISHTPNLAGSGPLELHAVRVSPAGALLDPAPISLGLSSASGGATQGHDVTFLDGQFLAVWSSPQAPEGLRRARVTPAGATLDPGGVPTMSGTAWSNGRPALAAGASNALLVWHGDSMIRGARIDAQGALLDPAGIDFASTPSPDFMQFDVAVSPPAVAFDGTNYLVAWQAADDGQRIFHSLRVSPGGAPLGPGSTLTIPGVIGPDELDFVALVTSGAGTLMAWDAMWEQEVAGNTVEFAGELSLLRLGPQGDFLDPRRSTWPRRPGTSRSRRAAPAPSWPGLAGPARSFRPPSSARASRSTAPRSTPRRR